jgi:hypothetical protein
MTIYNYTVFKKLPVKIASRKFKSGITKGGIILEGGKKCTNSNH